MVLVDLTPAEIADRARELANAEIEYGAIDDERSEMSSDYRTKLKLLRARIIELSQAVRTGKEERDNQLTIPAIAPETRARR